MKKESLPLKRNNRPMPNGNKPTQKAHQGRFDSLIMGVSRSTFINWLKELPSEERYLALRVQAPHITQQFLTLSKNGGICGKVENPQCKKEPTDKIKAFMTSSQNFLDSLTLISHEEFLDSIGFDFGFVGCPEKVYDTFSTILSYQNYLSLPQSNKISSQIDKTTQWILKTVSTINKTLQIKISHEWDSKNEIKKERFEKKEFGNFWNSMEQEEKKKFLYAGCAKVIELQDLIQKSFADKIDIYELRHEIDELLSTQSKIICNKIFKWRAKKGNTEMCIYYELLFNLWRQKFMKKKINSQSCLRDHHEKKVEKGQKVVEEQKGCERILKRKKNRKKKSKSPDASSNETNQTEIHEMKEVETLDVLRDKLEDDLEECTNRISEQANLFFPARVKAFKRIMMIFKKFGVETKLFGSCACGIAIGCSDVDMAISQNVLDFFPYFQTSKEKMKAAFEFFSSLFESFPWISNIKVINTASIPIIKFTINTELPVAEKVFSEEENEEINQPISLEGKVNIDLTVETMQERTSHHLGIISTDTIKVWAEKFPSLVPITVLLKYELARRSLNETYLGGLNTYSLVVMIVAFIENQDTPENTLVSVVLERLLRFYGWQFNEKNYGIDLLHEKKFFLKDISEEETRLQKADLIIKDPLCPDKNMTRNCYQFNMIKDFFRDIYCECFSKARHEISSIPEKNPKMWDLMKKEKFSYRKDPQLDHKNYFISYVFP